MQRFHLATLLLLGAGGGSLTHKPRIKVERLPAEMLIHVDDLALSRRVNFTRHFC
jgi:hypothetical protein